MIQQARAQDSLARSHFDRISGPHVRTIAVLTTFKCGCNHGRVTVLLNAQGRLTALSRSAIYAVAAQNSRTKVAATFNINIMESAARGASDRLVFNRCIHNVVFHLVMHVNPLTLASKIENSCTKSCSLLFRARWSVSGYLRLHRLNVWSNRS